MNYWSIVGLERTKATPKQKEQNLILKVCEMYDVTLENLTSKTRLRQVVEARYILFYILHKIQRRTSTEVGNLFSRDHATVLHGCNTIAGFIEFDKNFEEKISKLINENKYNLK